VTTLTFAPFKLAKPALARPLSVDDKIQSGNRVQEQSGYGETSFNLSTLGCLMKLTASA
jgi:hypothetical protein